MSARPFEAWPKQEEEIPAPLCQLPAQEGAGGAQKVAGKECRGWAEREWRWRAWIWPFVPLQSQISALAWLEHRSTGHVSARTLLRDRCFPRLPTASQEEQELQTSQGSVDELAGTQGWSRDPVTTVALLVPLAPGPPACRESLSQPAGTGTAAEGGREGITHLHGDCSSRGREGCPQPSPPTKNGFFPLSDQLGPR